MTGRSLGRRLRRTVVLVAVVSVAVLVLAPASALASHPGDDAVTSPDLSVVGQLSAADMGVLGENITDVWAAQSSSDGRDYAYLGTFDDIVCTFDWTGTHIVDITDPTSPQKVAFIADKPATRTNDVKVAHIDTKHFTGEILVATNEPCGAPFLPRLQANGLSGNSGRGGLSIWDVTDPTKPHALRQNFLPANGIHNTYIWQDGDNAYLIAVDDVALDDVIVVDITKPQAPQVIARTGAPDWIGSTSFSFAEIAGPALFIHDVWVQDGIAYVSYWDGGLVLLDVSDPANPVFLGDSTYLDPDPLSGEAPEGNSHNAIPNADGSLTWHSDEDFAAGSLTSFTVEGVAPVFGAAEGAFTTPTFSEPGAMFTGTAVTQGGSFGCTAGDLSPAPGADSVAIIQRGVCRFDAKAQSAIDQGYVGMVVYNDAARGDTLVSMAGDPRGIVGYFVGHSDGLAISDGDEIKATGLFDGYGYLRLFDTTDPTAITEIAQFATEGVFANPPLPGDRTIHNIDVDDSTHAYISWYAEGMRVVNWDGVDITETHHFVDSVNGSNFWGVYLYDHSTEGSLILGSDRNTGLWIFDDPHN